MKRLIVIAVSAALAGCMVRPPPEPRSDPYGGKQIYVASSDLRQETAVGDPAISRDDAGDILYVTVPIRSETSKELYVDYRVTFFDRNKQVLSQTGWFTKVLTPKVPDQIAVNSMEI